MVGVGLFLELYCPKLSPGILGLAVDLATLGQSTEGREEQSSPIWSQRWHPEGKEMPFKGASTAQIRTRL